MMTTPIATTSRLGQTVAYWAITAIVVGECVIGGGHGPVPNGAVLPGDDRPYPGYLATILAAAKLIAAVVLLVPGLPRLKELAYAGILINMVGAAASYVAMHQSAAANLVPPVVFTGLAVDSWALRPHPSALTRIRR